MTITITSTSEVTLLKTSALADGILCRVWEGKTESGIAVQVLIPRIAALATEDPTHLAQFEAELIEQPHAVAAGERAFPLRMLI